MNSSVDPREIADLASARMPVFIEALRELVNTDSGTLSPQGVNRIAEWCSARFKASGWSVERIPHQPAQGEPPLGDMLIGRLGNGGRPRILLLGHMDTVFPDGTAAARPFRMEGDRASGPGVSDMKSGLLAGFVAVDVLRALHPDWEPNLIYVCTPDEEIGSPFSKGQIEEIAKDVDGCFVLEAGREGWKVVTARKGMSTFVIEVTGRAAHAGVEPHKGVSAILEVAHKVLTLHALNGRWPGVTVNAGVVSGGTRPNVVAERCLLEVDLRAADNQAFDAATEEIVRIATTSSLVGTSASVGAFQAHRPMERQPSTGRLVALAREISHQLGFEVIEHCTGGVSDANTTSALGIPTLDGLGPIGGEPHSENEWLDLSSVAPRIALLGCLMARAGEALTTSP